MPDKKPRAKPTEAFRVRAFLTGPCQPFYGGTDYRQITLEVRVEPSNNCMNSDRAEFIIRAHSSKSHSDGHWFEPYLSELEYNGPSLGLSLREAQQAVKHLTTVQRYVAKLPVPPQNIRDLVMVLGKLHHFNTVDLARFKTPNSLVEQGGEGTSIHRLAYLAQEAFDSLQPKEEVPSA